MLWPTGMSQFKFHNIANEEKTTTSNQDNHREIDNISKRFEGSKTFHSTYHPQKRGGGDYYSDLRCY